MNLSEPKIRHFFVYGTLCRGQCREKLWPERPLRVTPAWTRGTLYGRSDYPAMRPGGDRVNGECWEFEISEVPRVLHVLDQIEGTNQPGSPNLYDRVIVEAFPANSPGTIIEAFGYHYACDPEPHGFERIRGDEIRWP